MTLKLLTVPVEVIARTGATQGSRTGATRAGRQIKPPKRLRIHFSIYQETRLHIRSYLSFT
eukprot:6297285-Heterocapsa_arctica.AAC.1